MAYYQPATAIRHRLQPPQTPPLTTLTSLQRQPILDSSSFNHPNQLPTLPPSRFYHDYNTTITPPLLSIRSPETPLICFPSSPGQLNQDLYRITRFCS